MPHRASSRSPSATLGSRCSAWRFQDLSWHNQFDGIWACASLLHVPAAELPGVMQRLRNALRPRGILYASFKYGKGEREHRGRRFTDLDEPGLAALLEQPRGLAERETWITSDLQ
jgi:SAM-dependent methyltransferase